VIPAAGGLPWGSELSITPERFRLTAGQDVAVTVHARNGGNRALRGARVTLLGPGGWTVEGDGDLGTLAPGGEATASFTVTAPAEFHPDVVRFREWTVQVGAEQVDTLIVPQVPIAQGETRELRVDLTNWSAQPQSGTVTVEPPEGFEVAEDAVAYSELAPGEQGAVSFTLTHSDPALRTANEGGEYDVTVRTATAAPVRPPVRSTSPQPRSSPRLTRRRRSTASRSRTSIWASNSTSAGCGRGSSPILPPTHPAPRSCPGMTTPCTCS
jgi:uncharacterized protein (DUF58 family)